MATRPSRLRRAPLKFSPDDNIGAVQSRNKVATENTESLNNATESAPAKTKSEKGILLAGKKTLIQISRSPILRDRTNLPAEPFKVDILVKKGADEIATKKTDKTMRVTAKRMATEEGENEAPPKAKRSRPAKAKDPEPAIKTTTERLSAQREKTRKPVTEKENTPKAVAEKGRTRKAVAKRENTENVSPAKENTDNTTAEKGNTLDLPMAKEKVKNGPAKEKARVKATSKKRKAIKETSASKNEDDSLVVESENPADSQNTPKVRTSKAAPRKTGKRVAFSKLSLSQQSNKTMENRKRKSLRRSSELLKKGQEDATTSGRTAAGKKFFKSKGVDTEKVLPGKKMTTGKRRKVERPRVSTSFRLRQTTLSESFAKQATKKNLRPRAAQKNYHESTIADKSSATDKDVTKGPVYKTAKLLEKSDEDGSEIYEFHFDSNDSRERIAKKKKKRARKIFITKRQTKASDTKKTISKPKVAAKIAVKKNEVENLHPVVSEKSEEPSTNDVPAIVVNDDFDMSPLPGSSEKIKTLPKRLEPQAQRVESRKSKPQIVESRDLAGEARINLTSTPQLTKSSEGNARPSRTTNAFVLPRPSVQYRTMLNHVLLNKSLSPIKKALENFDPGSPWRAPVITGPQFSRVKNVVQSTPQVRKFSTILGSNRNSLESKAESALIQINKISEKNEKSANAEPTNIQASAKMNEITETDENSENVEPINIKAPVKIDKRAENDKHSENVQQKYFKTLSKINKTVEKDEKSENVDQTNMKPQKILGLAKSPRKFGTVISNVNNVAIPSVNPLAIHENNAKSMTNQGSPRKNSIVASPRIAELSDTRISDGNDFDDHADKENSIPVFTSPKKSQKSPKKVVAKQSPLRPLNQAKIATKENWEPQPGPSGLQKRSPFGESRILRQSNLNNFLNIDEVPTSTRISTAHGIFGDAHSTPIPGKPVKVVNTEANVENAFGFDDIEESDIEISPVKSNLFADPPAAKVARKIFEKRTKIDGTQGVTVPSRFSIGEIKKHLRPVVSKGNVKADPVERIERDENRENREEKAENKKGEDAVTFSDTFDVLTAAAEANDKENEQEVPLFADLEPVRFKQPPRHSYKRKRAVAFNFSEDEDDNEDGESHGRVENNGTKKRKISRVERQRQKQMEEWAKGLNNTFEEIDHFDLVVEKQ